MKVEELIELLKTYPKDLQVAYQKFSEQCLLEAEQIRIEDLCPPRHDGWIQNKRDDMPLQTYLVFPGY